MLSPHDQRPVAGILSILILFFLAGLIASQFIHVDTALSLNLCLTATLTSLLAFLLRKTIAARLSLALCIAFYGFHSGTFSSTPPAGPDTIYQVAADRRETVLIGAVDEMPRHDGQTSQFILRVLSYSPQLDGQLVPVQGKILLRANGPLPHSCAPGNHIAVRAAIERPRPATTPGTFDYSAYLARNGIWASGFIRAPEAITEVDTGQIQSPIATFWHLLRYLPESMRYSIGSFLDSHLAPQQAALYRAVLIGDTSKLQPETLEHFKASGTFHILAISGSHIAVISLFSFTVLYWLLRRSEYLMLRVNVRKIALLCCIPTIFLYSFLAGGNSPVLRSVLMSGTAALAFCVDRPKSWTGLILLAAFLILLVHPQELFTASFQLSFAAVICIVAIGRLIEKKIPPDSPQQEKRQSLLRSGARWLAVAVLVCCAASLGTAPLLIYYFNRMPLYGIPSTLLVEPLISLWALLLALLALPLIQFAPVLAAALFRFGAVGLSAAENISEWFASLPANTLWFVTPPIWLCVAYFVGLAGVIWQLSRNRSPVFSLLAVIACAGMFFLPVSQFFQPAHHRCTVSYIDVGQGSASLLETPEGKRILVDGGGSSFSKESVGSRIIAPFLWQKGISKIDMIINTHPDADHYNGLTFITEHFSPRLVWVSSEATGDANYAKFLESVAASGAKIISPAAGDSVPFGTTQVSCLFNPAKTESLISRNHGLIIRVTHGQSSFLFPGDSDEQLEQQLVQSALIEPSTILLAAHHGSRSSNSSAFLKAVAPKLLIVSAGNNENGSFPHERLRRYCKDNSLPLFTTREVGSMEFRQEGNSSSLLRLTDTTKNPLLQQPGEQVLWQWIAGEQNTVPALRPQ